MEFVAQIHHEDGSYWAEIAELPGCFASGDTLDELAEALQEAIVLYLADSAPEAPASAAVASMTVATSELQPA